HRAPPERPVLVRGEPHGARLHALLGVLRGRRRRAGVRVHGDDRHRPSLVGPSRGDRVRGRRRRLPPVAADVRRSNAIDGRAVVAIIITQPVTRIAPGVGGNDDSKSNAGEIATLAAPELPAGSLVLVSQPEAVPLFEHYLGPNLRYGDPRGPATDPTVMDWR